MADRQEEPATVNGAPLRQQMDAWAARLDARFTRAALGTGCWNCGCPDAEYVRMFESEAARVPVPLDVERLARAMDEVMRPMRAGRWAPRIAAEYNRSNQPSTEPAQGGTNHDR